MSNNFFSINGNLEKFNFPTNTTIWLRDIFQDVYEEYLYTFDESHDKPFKFKVINENDSIMEISKFSFETEKEGIETLIKYHSPKFTKDGEITIESKCEFSKDSNSYIYNMTKYPTAYLVDLSDIFVSEHKYSRDIDPYIDIINLPPICVKYTKQDGYLYEIIDGYHRTKYSKLKGFTKIPVILY